MSASLKTVNYRNPNTPQTQKAVKGQKKNDAGGYTFVPSEFDQAKRFIILGAADGYYLTGEQKANQGAKNLIKLIEEGASQNLVDFITEVSTEGRAAKQSPGLFALAVASSFGTTEEKQYALSKLNAVARTASTLFEFIGYALQFRSWGRALKRAVANWYTSKPVDKLAYQMVKYQNRNGWSHGDALRVSHPKGSKSFDLLAQYALGKEDMSFFGLPNIVLSFESAKHQNEDGLIYLIRTTDLSWEMIPNDKRTPKVWEALVPKMPLGALIRQLPTLTRAGILSPLSDSLFTVVDRLKNEEEIKRARLHPINILLAAKVYESNGVYSRGSNTWKADPQVISALGVAFEKSFVNVEATGLKFYLGLDVSGSMGVNINDSALTSYEAVGAIAMMLAKTEPKVHMKAFTRAGGSYWSRGSELSEVPITSEDNLRSAVTKMHELGNKFGGTDCALPVKDALKNKIFTDVFVILTDNDTWGGSQHVHEALRDYRKQINPNAKLVVLSTQANRASVADPRDPMGQLDIAGFDSAVPKMLREFALGF